MSQISNQSPQDNFANWKVPSSNPLLDAIDQEINSIVATPSNPLSLAIEEITAHLDQSSSLADVEDFIKPTLEEAVNQIQELLIQSPQLKNVSIEQIKEAINQAHESWSNEVNALVQKRPQFKEKNIFMLAQKRAIATTAPTFTMSLQQAYSTVNSWNPASNAGVALKSVILSELAYQLNQPNGSGSLAAARNDLENGGGTIDPPGMRNADIYMFAQILYIGTFSFPGSILAPSDANVFFQIFSIPPTPPTTVDNTFVGIINAQITYTSNGQSGAVDLMAALVAQFFGSNGWGSNATAVEMINWAASQIANNTPVWQNGGEAQTTIESITGVNSLYASLYAQYQKYLSQGNAADAALFNAAMQQYMTLGINSTDLTNWASQLMIQNYPNNLYGNADSAAQESFATLCSTTVISNALTFQSQLPQNLSTALMHYIQGLVNNEQPGEANIPQQVVAWINSVGDPTNQDVYFRYPNISSAQAKTFYAIASLPVPTNIPTPADQVIIAASKASSSNPQVETLITSLITYMEQNCKSNTPLSTLQNWLTTQFPANNDIFFQIPTISASDLTLLYTTIFQGLPVPAPTSADDELIATTQWLQGPPTPIAADAALATALVQQLQNLGSNGKIFTITTWADNIIQNQFAQFPGVSVNGINTFEAITGGSSNPLKSALKEALAWQQEKSLAPNSQSYLLATTVVNEIEGLLAQGGNMASLKDWVAEFTPGPQDFYMQFSSMNQKSTPPLTETDLQQLYSIALLGTAPPMKRMDANYNALLAWANNAQLLGTPVANGLLEQIYAFGSLDGEGASQTFASWVRAVMRGTNPTSRLFAALPVLVKAAFERL